MFYDALGSLIGQAGDAIQRSREAGPDDARSQRETRQIALLLRRTRGIWPQLFETLAAETGVLLSGLDEANVELARHDLETSRVEPSPDPLAYHRAVERALDLTVERLCEQPVEDWTDAALSRLRRCLAEAAEIQGRLVDQMLAIR